jgi:predicted enzyme related to lactoylglutathione lyase
MGECMQQSLPSILCYFEIPSPNIEKAGTFYSSIFGWKFTISNLTENKYWEFSTGEGQLSGGLDSTKSPVEGGVIVYLKVENIDTILTKVEAHGGKVLRSKFNIGGGYGFSAIFKDPNGNVLGLFAAK